MVHVAERTSDELSALDLALRLGIRTEAVLSALGDLGLETDDPTVPLDPRIEEQVVERMVENGQIARRALKSLHKRRRPPELAVDDRILREALGASESGYSENAVPDQVAHLFEKKSSFLQRLGFGRARPVEEQEITSVTVEPEPDVAEPEGILAPPPEAQPTYTPQPESPRESVRQPEPERPPKPAPETQPEPEELSEPEEDLDFEDLDLDLEEEEETEISAQAEKAPILPASESALQEESDEEIDLTDLDLEGEAEEGEADLEIVNLDLEEEESPAESTKEAEEKTPGEALDAARAETEEEEEEEEHDGLLNEEDESVLEGLKELDLGDFGVDEQEAPEEEAKPEVEEPDLDIDVSQEELPEMEIKEEKTEKEKEEEEEVAKNFLERLIERLDLTQTEIIVAAAGALLIATTGLGLAVYYYLNYSPKKASELWEQGYRAYQSEVLGEQHFGVIVDSFTRLLVNFPTDTHLEEAAYLLAMSFFRRAEELAETDPSAAKARYADAVEYFEKFLIEQRRIGDRLAKSEGAGYRRYMDTAKEEDAHYYIALCYEKQLEYQQAIDAYQAFLQRYKKSPRTTQILVTLGNIYKRWADIDENSREERLLTAISKYEEALADPATNMESRIALHTLIGDIWRKLYDHNPDREVYILGTLRGYRNAESLLAQTEAKSAEYFNLQRDLALGLADTLLILGQNASKEAENIEASAEDLPRSSDLRASQLAAAEITRATAAVHLSEAIYLYSRLIGMEPTVPLQASASGQILSVTGHAVLSEEQQNHVRNNLAEAYFYMGRYEDAMNIAIPLIETLSKQDPGNPYLASLCYLVGDAAWKEGDYDRRVVDYYRLGRKYCPLFPPGSGERSNVAALRMANIYYQRGMEEGNPRDLQSAIEEYLNIIREFPDTKWTYLTRYWLARTYERYAEVLADPKSDVYDPAKAKEYYQLAYMQYEVAITARVGSVNVDKKNQDKLKDCYFRPGRCAYKAGNLEKAKDLLGTAIVWSATGAPGDPRAIPCREMLGDIYLELGHPDQAIRIYEYYLENKFYQQDERGDSLSRVSLKLARAYLRRFSYGQARELLRQVVRDNPVVLAPGGKDVVEGPGLEAQRLLAQSYRDEAEVSFVETRKDKLRSAKTEYLTLLQMNPNEWDAVRALAEISFDLADPENPDSYREAINFYQKYIESDMVELAEDRDVVYYRWADCYARIGDYENAATALEKINGTTIPKEMYARSLLLLGECYQKLAAQTTDEFRKQYYTQKARKTYKDTIETQDPFAAQVARNRITLMNIS
ncbi:MAG TPA: tetratricopeptide repeat protein [bacterium]|mgnify:CR=1 FL=1|nr:tetratricopeptide repeat protein [bacterium]HQL60910.1 tetratricopeptide repeat protein [bacterium]